MGVVVGDVVAVLVGVVHTHCLPKLPAPRTLQPPARHSPSPTHAPSSSAAAFLHTVQAWGPDHWKPHWWQLAPHWHRAPVFVRRPVHDTLSGVLVGDVVVGVVVGVVVVGVVEVGLVVGVVAVVCVVEAVDVGDVDVGVVVPVVDVVAVDVGDVVPEVVVGVVVGVVQTHVRPKAPAPRTWHPIPSHLLEETHTAVGTRPSHPPANRACWFLHLRQEP